jgi:hypothetical protein
MAFNGAAKKMQQFVCGLRGHDVVRHFGTGRVSLQCVSCGHESPGWVMPVLTARRSPDAPTSPRGPHQQHAS